MLESDRIELNFLACQAKLMNKLRPLAAPCLFLVSLEGEPSLDPKLLAIAVLISDLFKDDPAIVSEVLNVLEK